MDIEFLLYFSLFFFLGLFLGSFLQVAADRIFHDEPFFFNRSYCEYCKHVLSFADLFPVLSFLFLHGRCRYCKKKLSWYYPFSELFTGSIFALTYYAIGMSSSVYLVYVLIIVSGCLTIFFSDVKYGIIPDKIVFFLTTVTFIYHIIFNSSILFSFIFSALGAGGFFLLLFLITKGRGMGFGDVKFAFLMGFILGFPFIIYALYVAFLTGACVSFILIWWRKKQLKSTIPFGPFLVAGTLIVLLFPKYVDQVVQMVLP